MKKQIALVAGVMAIMIGSHAWAAQRVFTTKTQPASLSGLSRTSSAVVEKRVLLAKGYHYVRPHVRSNGSYVRGHYRTNPDRSVKNNWSTHPNVNPFTGAVGTRRISESNNSGSHNSNYFRNSIGTSDLLDSPIRAPRSSGSVLYNILNDSDDSDSPLDSDE